MGRGQTGTHNINPWTDSRGKTWQRCVIALPRRDGKRKQKTFLGETKEEVRAQVKAWEAERHFDGPVDPQRITLQSYCERWLARDSDRRRPITLDSYERKLRVHVYPELGNILLSKLLPAHCTDLWSAMKRKGLAERSVQYTRTILRSILKHAVREELISRNPTDRDEMPRFPRDKRPKQKEIILPEDLDQVVSAIQRDRLFPFFYLALATGARRGELCAVRWSDVHLNGPRPYVYIQHSTQELSKQKGGIIHDDTKTDESTRPIHIPQTVVKALQQYRRDQAAMRQRYGAGWNRENLVFTSTKGGRIRPSLLTNRWKQIRDKAGAPGVRLHDLRHTHATALLAKGVPVKTVQSRLGHRNYNITMDIYSHVIKQMEDQAVDVVADLLPDVSGGKA